MLFSKGRCAHALQPIGLSRAYGVAFPYPSFDSSVHSVQLPVSVRETHSEPTFCIAWERHCAWSLRLSHIYESPEISRSGEGGAQQSIRFATECVCGFP